MSNKLHSIRKKVNDVGFGILRFREMDKQESLQVRVRFSAGSSLYCFTQEKMELKALPNKVVSLVQKQDDDYLYLSGQVEEISGAAGGKIVCVRIFKASWFVKRSKGTLSWLQEKHVYELPPGEGLRMVS